MFVKNTVVSAPDWAVGEDDGIFLGVFEDDLAARVQPHPALVLALQTEVHRLDLLRVDH